MASQFPFLSGIEILGPNVALLEYLEKGNFEEVLKSVPAQRLLGFSPLENEEVPVEVVGQNGWPLLLSQQVEAASNNEELQTLLIIGLTALQAFLQSNVTGPPLGWKSSDICIPARARQTPEALKELQASIIKELSVDGEAAYHLMPHVELLHVARIFLTNQAVCGQDGLLWARVRVNMVHQQMLNETAATLQDKIYGDMVYLEGLVLGGGSIYDAEAQAKFLLERAAIHIHHGFDKKARDDLAEAAKRNGFDYVLTGRLGKRTKFQQQELSQLVVLAKSKEKVDGHAALEGNVVAKEESDAGPEHKPANLDLNDDTLLESIAFSRPDAESVAHEENIPAALAALDASKQPLLDPLDSVVLLSYASSITNTSPEDGITREETLPYATRVLDGGSSNWQVYTQALLVRSRIEGYSSRTVERGVLQLQALVDQVIAETTEALDKSTTDRDGAESTTDSTPTTFLPRAKESESAPVTERLQYIYQLASPPRWSLEAELAQRWVGFGGLRTALEIYERLEMWAEAALCWAATEREDKALRLVRKQLYLPGPSKDPKPVADGEEVEEQYYGEERDPLPADATRLFCIVGDLESTTEHYERAWTVSNHRYARAQRSLGKYYMTHKDPLSAEAAFALSLKANPQNGAAWFTLGCIRLELRKFADAANAFSRTLSSEPDDAEAWSNLAAALLRMPPEETASDVPPEESDEPSDAKAKVDSQKHVKEAFVAFKRATTLKRDNYRIWHNLLNVAATLSPPPYSDVIIAQQRLIELRSNTEGEGCIDIEIMEGLLSHVITNFPAHTTASDAAINEKTPEQRGARFGLERRFSDLVQKDIMPLITHSRRLWQLVARLMLHLNRPSSALDAYEKAWRLTLNKPGWEGDAATNMATDGAAATPEKVWDEVVEATVELVDAYESLGEREATEGLKAGTGELVCANWKYKGRMAVRSVIGRRTKAGLEGVERLRERMEDLKGGG